MHNINAAHLLYYISLFWKIILDNIIKNMPFDIQQTESIESFMLSINSFLLL